MVFFQIWKEYLYWVQDVFFCYAKYIGVDRDMLDAIGLSFTPAQSRGEGVFTNPENLISFDPYNPTMMIDDGSGGGQISFWDSFMFFSFFWKIRRLI